MKSEWEKNNVDVYRDEIQTVTIHSCYERLSCQQNKCRAMNYYYFNNFLSYSHFNKMKDT